MGDGVVKSFENLMKWIDIHYVSKTELRKVLKKWYQYEWSGEQDSLYIDLKKLLEDE